MNQKIDQAEDFFGPSRTSANFRRRGWLNLLGFSGAGAFLFSMLWWGEPASVANPLELLIHFAFSKLFPLALIVLGILAAVNDFRLGKAPEVETLWYRLDRAGLHILHNLNVAALTERVQNPQEPRALIAWSAIKAPITIIANPPRVKITRCPPRAVIDRTATLIAGQKSRDGLLFEERLRAWLNVMQAR